MLLRWSLCILWLFLPASLGLGPLLLLPSWFWERPSPAAMVSAGTTRHQRMQPPAPTRPQRFPTALSNICCVPQSPRGSVCFPIKLVSRVRLVALKIEDRRRLRGGLGPNAVRPRFPPRRSGPEAPPPVFGFRKMSNSLRSSDFVGGNFPPGRSCCGKLQVNSKGLWEVGFYLFLVNTDGMQVECWAGRNRTSGPVGELRVIGPPPRGTSAGCG